MDISDTIRKEIPNLEKFFDAKKKKVKVIFECKTGDYLNMYFEDENDLRKNQVICLREVDDFLMSDKNGLFYKD